MTRTEKFWRWLLDLATERVREAAMARTYHERQCPNCLQWTGVVGVADYHRDSPSIGIDTMYCGACGFGSEWDMRYGPVVPLASPKVAENRLAALPNLSR